MGSIPRMVRVIGPVDRYGLVLWFGGSRDTATVRRIAGDLVEKAGTLHDALRPVLEQACGERFAVGPWHGELFPEHEFAKLSRWSNGVPIVHLGGIQLVSESCENSVRHTSAISLCDVEVNVPEPTHSKLWSRISLAPRNARNVSIGLDEWGDFVRNAKIMNRAIVREVLLPAYKASIERFIDNASYDDTSNFEIFIHGSNRCDEYVVEKARRHVLPRVVSADGAPAGNYAQMLDQFMRTEGADKREVREDGFITTSPMGADNIYRYELTERSLEVFGIDSIPSVHLEAGRSAAHRSTAAIEARFGEFF